MLGLYRANINMVNFASPDPKNEELQDNIDFMIEYLKIKLAREMTWRQNDDNYWVHIELESATKKYERAMSNPEFIVRLAEAFPNQQIIPLIKKSLIKCHILDDDMEQKRAQDRARYKECLSNLPIKFLCDQVRKYGWSALDVIPNDIPNFNQIVSVGIETDGFKSLEYLDITQVYDNIDLVIKAYEKDGIKKLAEYTQHSLSPRRTHYYMCHEEAHEYTTYDKRYEEVQKALLSSPEIQTVFKKEKLIAKMKEVKTTHLSIESCANEEDVLCK